MIGDARERCRRATGQRDLDRRPADRADLRRTSAGQDADIGMAADHDDRARAAGERQDIAVVLQQDDAGLGRALRHLGMCGIVDRLCGGGGRVVVQSARDHAGQDAVDHLVEPRGRDTSGLHRVGQWCAEEHLRIEFLSRFLVETGVRGFLGRMYRAPVGHHEAGVFPVAAQHVGQQDLVLARIVAVDPIIRAHHRAGLSLGDRDLEREQVAFAQSRGVDLRIEDRATGLLAVQHEMLDRRDDVARLHATDRRAAHDPGQQRILAEIFEVTPVPGIARQVHAAGKQHVERFRARLRADHRAAGIGDRRIEAGGGGKAGRQRGRNVALALFDLVGDAERCIALAQRRDAEAGHAGHVARRRDHVRRRRLGHRWEEAVDILQFLGLRHGLDQSIGALGGRPRRLVPCPRQQAGR